MPRQLLILFLLFSTAAYSQDTSSFKPFIKSFERNFSIDDADPQDSCLTTYTLLKIDIDLSYDVSSVSISDNAPDWQRKALNNVKRKLDIKSLEIYAQKNGLKSVSLFFPFMIRRHGSADHICLNSPSITNLFFQFNGNSIKGNCLFVDRIDLIYY